MKRFHDWENRVNYQIRQQEVYKCVIAKKRVFRLRSAPQYGLIPYFGPKEVDLLLTPQEKDARAILQSLSL